MKNCRKQIILSVGLVLLSVVLLYANFLWNPIVFDDLPFFYIDKAGNQPVSENHFNLLQIRSLPYATLAWTVVLFGLDLIYFRLGNLLLHSAVCIALFGFFKEIFEIDDASNTNASKLSAQWLAFFSALLFALHPVATYAVGYLVQRTIVMATLFSVLAMWSYAYGSKHDNPAWLWLTLPLYYLAVFSKEHAITLVAVLLALTMLLHADWQQKMRQRIGLFVGLLTVALFAILARKGIIGSVYETNAAEMLDSDLKLAYPLSVITQAALFFKYVFLWLLPNPAWMSIDMREPFAHSFFSYYLFGVIAYLAWGAAGLWLLLKRGSKGLLGLALLYPWLMFFTEFSTVRIQESFVLYRSYLWAIGSFFALPAVFAKVKARPAAGILIACATVYVPISMERLATMSHPLLLWDDAEKLVANHKELPGVSRIYYNRGNEYAKVDFNDKAIADLQHAVALRPKYVEAYGNLGVIYLKKHDWPNAASAFSKAIDISNETGAHIAARYYQGRADALTGAGDLTNAQLDYRESCRLGARACDKVH